MYGVSCVLSILATASIVVAVPHYGLLPSKNIRSASPLAANARVIYTMSNAVDNSIIAMKVAADGTLSDGSTTSTGGKGMSGIDSMTNKTAGPDALFSQSPIAVKGNVLVAVNPGSNTLSMMIIDINDPCKLTLVGSPVPTMGEFPVTAAISPKNRLACVGNTGAKSGLACFAITRKGLVPKMQQQIDFNLGQTTPPVGPFTSISQVLFNADESSLLTTVKGDPTKNTTGFLSILPITPNGQPATKDTRTSPAGTNVLFGSALVPGSSNKLFATDAAFGAATISIDSSPKVLAKTSISGQKATCWVTISPLTKSAFVTDVATNRIVEIDPTKGGVKQITDMSSQNGNSGLIDLVAAGKMVYALSPGNGTTKAAIAVLDVSKQPAKLVQNFEPKGDVGKASQGLALFL
ncbi:MAG: hypothetical protein Q9218_006648 [Villophora microphyllina]